MTFGEVIFRVKESKNGYNCKKKMDKIFVYINLTCLLVYNDHICENFRYNFRCGGGSKSVLLFAEFDICI